MTSYQHLSDAQEDKIHAQKFKPVSWLALMRKLDSGGVQLDLELPGKTKEVMIAVRRKGKKVDTWDDCLIPNVRTSLEDGKIHLLKREVTHALHNQAKNAMAQIRKVVATKAD